MNRAFLVGALVLVAMAFADDGKSLKQLLDDCNGEDRAAARKAADEVLVRFIDSPELEGATDTISRAWYFEHFSVATVESGLRTIIAKSPHRNVRAQAMLDLAEWFFGVDKAGKAKRFEACDLLDAIQKDYADAPCAAKAKEYAEFHTRALVAKEKKVARRPGSDFEVGKTAPDFEAEDQDGKTFKLSDYRGKIVLIDFWGFW